MAALCITLLVGETHSHCNGASSVAASHCSETLQAYFGSLGSALFTLIASIAGGLDWHSVATILLDEVGIWAFLFMVVYVVFVVFALVNAVTGVFVDSALRSSEKAEYTLLASMAQNVFKQFSQSDEGDEVIDRLQFLDAMEGPTLRTFFANLDVNIDHPQMIFDLIDQSGSGTINVREFVECIHKLKGNTKALDFCCFENMWRDAHEGLAGQVDVIESNLSKLTENLASSVNESAPLNLRRHKSSSAILEMLAEEVRCLNQMQCEQTIRHEEFMTREMTKIQMDQAVMRSKVPTFRTSRLLPSGPSPAAAVEHVECDRLASCSIDKCAQSKVRRVELI
eukprot:TRINITY_DN14099_c0_g2_i1.p1 TRINITY_DN14099_c0_g2~~TRINITY_DN14099_c0_g2_i1.p1  ORF type:complete len:353 (+),score=46.33 TRINITY_DN14099_c0_g2_i1:45-1061(+)